MDHRSRPARRLARTVVVTGLLAGALGAAPADAQAPGRPDRQSTHAATAAPSARREQARQAQQAPTLRIRTVASGLDVPWDVSFTPGGRMFITERDRGRILVRGTDGVTRVLVSSVPNLWVSGETGLMSILVDPDFPTNRRFYVCHGFESSQGRDIRVVAWRTNDAVTSAVPDEILVKGIRVSSGRHGGCRLRFGGSGALFIGTGDAAITGTARDRGSLAGKVLRVNRSSGAALPSNPFYGSPNANTRKIWTFGHRNVQGLAPRPGGTRMWSVEHGPDRDDEVNRLEPGGDYGWQAGPGYDENRPMTDHSLPGRQFNARWSSGYPTVATSGATWLRGARWGSWRGALAVAALKDQSLRIMRFDGGADLISVARPAALADDFGRLRSAVLGPNNVLYLTTSNGGGTDRVLAVSTA